jgi:hypothetical protein
VIGKFGKLPARHDPRTLRLAKYIDQERPLRPKLYREWSTTVAQWGMYANDVYGSCTCAAAAHAIRCWSVNDGAPNPVTTEDVLAAYSAVSGFDPSRPETDRGAYILDVLHHWRTVGIGGHRIKAYLALDPQDHMQRMMAIELGGCIYSGYMLPDTIWHERVWADTSGRLGSAGGHAMIVPSYSPSSLTAITWNREQLMTPEFADWACDESYVLLSEDFTGEDGVAPNGFRLDELWRDLERVTA